MRVSLGVARKRRVSTGWIELGERAAALFLSSQGAPAIAPHHTGRFSQWGFLGISA